MNVETLCYDNSNPACTGDAYGSSFSAPQVTALAALINSVNYGTFKNWPEPVRAIILSSAIHDVDGTNYYSANTDAKDGAGAVDAAVAYQIATAGRWNASTRQGNYNYGSINSSTTFPIVYGPFPGLVRGETFKASLVWNNKVTCANANSASSGCGSYNTHVDLDIHYKCDIPNGIFGVQNTIASSTSSASNWESLQYKMPNSLFPPQATNCYLVIDRPLFAPAITESTYFGIAWWRSCHGQLCAP